MDMNTKPQPLFCVEVLEKVSGRKLFINFGASKTVVYPDVDYDEKKLKEEMVLRGMVIEEYKIPLISSPIFWAKEQKEDYVIEIVINDKFAFRRIIKSQFMRLYLIEVAMLCIEEKFNATNSDVRGQCLGHKLDINMRQYEVKKDLQRVERSEMIVNNRVNVLEDQEKESEKPKYQLYCLKEGVHDKNCDIYYRPKSGMLTCSILTDTLPDALAFNDDRIVVKQKDKILMDVCLPYSIDLNEAAKYKFFEKYGVFRIVFKVIEQK